MIETDINELVAQKLGWTWNEKVGWRTADGKSYLQSSGLPTVDFKELPDYCTDIKAAWEVVENLNQNGTTIAIVNRYDKEWSVKIMDKPPGLEIVADTAPMAIALCFLKLSEVK